MKYKLLLALVIVAGLFSCSKNNDDPETPGLTPGESTAVLYIDTFRVYSTDLKGGNRKLLIDEDLKSGNNYIAATTILPGSGKIAYVYITGYQDPKTLKITNADGSAKKILKTLAAGSDFGFIKGMVDNKIYYSVTTRVANVSSVTYFSIKDDGSGETELKGIPFQSYMYEAQISNQGKGMLLNAGYFAKIKDGVFNEADSYNVFVNETQANMMGKVMVSNDAAKIAFVSKTATAGKYEVRVKDITTRNTTSVVAYTYTVPAEFTNSVFNDFFELQWANGTKSLILEYGKSSSPGAASDYMFCQLIDVATGNATNWKFTGDGNAGIIVN